MSEFERVAIPSAPRGPAAATVAILELIRDDSSALRVPVPDGLKPANFRYLLVSSARYRNVRIATRIQDGHVVIWRRK